MSAQQSEDGWKNRDAEEETTTRASFRPYTALRRSRPTQNDPQAYQRPSYQRQGSSQGSSSTTGTRRYVVPVSNDEPVGQEGPSIRLANGTQPTESILREERYQERYGDQYADSRYGNVRAVRTMQVPSDDPLDTATPRLDLTPEVPGDGPGRGVFGEQDPGAPSFDTDIPGARDGNPLPRVPRGPRAVNDPLVRQRDPCEEAQSECRPSLEELRSRTLSDIDLEIGLIGIPGKDYPCDCELPRVQYVPRQFATTHFFWTASALCHKPLYFEQIQMERYGHSVHWAVDPFLSAAHFFVTLPVLPYKMGMDPPMECEYALGYHRPGNCAPWYIPAVPLSARGAVVQGMATAGAVLVFP